MRPRSGRPGAGSRAALAVAILALAPLPAAVPAQAADSCPLPVVQRIHGPAGGAMASEVALNTTVTLNRGSVRFVEYLPGGGGSGGGEYTLAAAQTDRTVSLTLTDPRGRPVAASSAPIRGEGEVAAGETAAHHISPLLPKIRAHQRRVRAEEESAIHASLTVDPRQASAAVEERVELTVELRDCDDMPLARSPVDLEHSGVGRLDASSLATDAQGRARVGFVGDRAGEATVTPGWRHENTEGVPMVALPEAASRIRVEDDRWELTADVEARGEMTTVGNWQGTFRLVEGDRIEGDGTITTTVTGSCVSGTKAVPMRITGHRAGETLYVTVVGEDDDSEPTTQLEESLRCAVQTLIELPAFFAGLARLMEMAVMNEPCPIRVPTGPDRVAAECAGVTFHVRRLASR